MKQKSEYTCDGCWYKEKEIARLNLHVGASRRSFLAAESKLAELRYRFDILQSTREGTRSWLANKVESQRKEIKRLIELQTADESPKPEAIEYE